MNARQIRGQLWEVGIPQTCKDIAGNTVQLPPKKIRVSVGNLQARKTSLTAALGHVQSQLDAIGQAQALAAASTSQTVAANTAHTVVATSSSVTPAAAPAVQTESAPIAAATGEAASGSSQATA
jgi:hypothetical protein